MSTPRGTRNGLRYTGLKMNCPGCGATMHLDEDRDYLACAYCRNISFPEKNEDGVRVLEEASALQCPACVVALTHAAVGGRRILYCERCRGTLIAMDLFMGLMAERSVGSGDSAAVRSANPAELERRVLCPQCRRPMNTHYYAGPGHIVIDTCSECHLNWLDHGELRRVLRAPDPGFPESLREV